MTFNVVVEGQSDLELIDKLISDLRISQSISIVAAGGKDAARPLARQLAILERAPVVLVLDSDASSEEQARKNLQDLRSYFSLAGISLESNIFLFTPTIEVIFFDRPNALERCLRKRLSATDLAIGKIGPKRMLNSLLGSSARVRRFVAELDDDALSDLRKQAGISELRMKISGSGGGGRRKSSKPAKPSAEAS